MVLRARGRARSHAAGTPMHRPTVNPAGRRLLNLSDWPVARRLFAVIVAALLMGVIFGGLRVADAENSATQFSQVSQPRQPRREAHEPGQRAAERARRDARAARRLPDDLGAGDPAALRADWHCRHGCSDGNRRPRRRPPLEHPDRRHLGARRHRRDRLRRPHRPQERRQAARHAGPAGGRPGGHLELRRRHQRHDRPGRPGRPGCLRRVPGQRCAGAQRPRPGEGPGVRAARAAQLRFQRPAYPHHQYPVRPGR